MSLSVPITNGEMTAGAMAYNGPSAAPPVASSSAADVQGTGPLTGLHNTPLHVGGILLFAGLVIAGYHLAGFRMGFDVGLGRG